MTSIKNIKKSITNQKNIKVFIICPTLGYINRGIESFTQECFDELSTVPFLDVTLFKGSGTASNKNITLPSLHNNSWLKSQFVQAFSIVSNNQSRRFVEDGSFFLSFLPHLYYSRPDIVYFSHYLIGSLLWHWRNLTKLNYKLLYRNGGPTGGEALKKLKMRFDHIQQLSPTELQKALNVGVPAEKQSLVPNAIHMPSELQIATFSEQQALRRKLNLPETRVLIISVAAINKSHKRMDYVVREISALPEPHPYLLLLGQQGAETPEIFQLANKLLGSDNFQIRTVNQHKVPDYYKVADIFVLASLRESFGRVTIEAMSHGLPCLVHDYEVTQFLLGEQGYMADFELNGSLTNLIIQVLAEGKNISKHYARHKRVYEHFSWDSLCQKYLNLIENCANS